MEIDINCDMGESYGQFFVGNDALIFPYITSCNVACGFHGGDPLHIEHTIKGALDHGVQLGVHPSYPDLQGFGRRKIKMKAEELKAVIKYQIAAVKGMAESLGGKLMYVKPHGALYNEMTVNETEALTVIEAIREVAPQLALMGLAGSMLEQTAEKSDMVFIPEAFADRRYEADGTLVSRSKEEAVIKDPELAVRQVLSIVRHKVVETVEGTTIPIHARSICIHGDNTAAVAILKTLSSTFKAYHITKRKFTVL